VVAAQASFTLAGIGIAQLSAAAAVVVTVASVAIVGAGAIVRSPRRSRGRPEN
jgi:hypothetical protein